MTQLFNIIMLYIITRSLPFMQFAASLALDTAASPEGYGSCIPYLCDDCTVGRWDKLTPKFPRRKALTVH